MRNEILTVFERFEVVWPVDIAQTIGPSPTRSRLNRAARRFHDPHPPIVEQWTGTAQQNLGGVRAMRERPRILCGDDRHAQL
jgi:hypothetical protein